MLTLPSVKETSGSPLNLHYGSYLKKIAMGKCPSSLARVDINGLFIIYPLSSGKVSTLAYF